MGELVAWGLGLALGYAVRDMLTGRWRIILFALAIVAIGTLITLSSGEIASAPWLVIVDILQVAVAALIGAFAVPFALRRFTGAPKPEAH
jgi:hypothetical protein